MFDRIVVVDWSANGSPKRGADSIWCAVLHTADGTCSLVNHPTRRVARDALLTELAAPGRTLVGFDFPLGFPTGFAAAMGLEGTPWSATWQHLTGALHDDEWNRNDRWQVAADGNHRLGRPHFWGAPASAARPTLPRTRPEWTAAHLPALRLPEARLRARGLRPFSVWQLLGAGSVGSQTLTGIPVVHHLRHHHALRDRVRVWPFETGLKAPDDAHDITVAEVWPSSIPFDHVDHTVKDARQVTALAHHFVALDAAGELDALFTPTMPPGDAADVVREEGWVLGLG